LRVVARYGVGVDRVDLGAAAERGVTVTTTPGANANAVAEFTIGLLFALARPLVEGRDQVRAGEWPALRGVELTGKTLGLVGLGRIGSLVAAKSAALGMRVLAYDPNVTASEQASLVGLDALARESDFVSLHAPLTDGTRGMVARPLLERMKFGSALVNTARGELVDETALLWALEEGPLKAAALDVLGDEPPPAWHPLLGRDDVIITPHIAPHTAEATAAMGRMAVDELLNVLSGRQARFPVPLPAELSEKARSIL
ncbi:MAG: NAD(P)-dependent oxidoreductase, partial [Acidimicrobiales bacterium]